MYAALLLVSVGVIISALVLMTKGEFGMFAPPFTFLEANC